MSSRCVFFILLSAVGFVGCTDNAGISTGSLSPELVKTYKTSLVLAHEPEQATSVLVARTLALGVPATDIAATGIADNDHDHATHDHAAHAQEGLDDHAGHDHDAHEQGHDEHTGDNDDHAAQDHADHDHADHAGHELAGDDDEHGHSGHSHDEHGEHIVIVGKIGGAPGAERSSDDFPFEKGKASFVIFDPSFESAHGDQHGDHKHAEGDDCPFCQNQAGDAQALVRFLGKDGKPLAIDARDLFGVKENDLVVVKGHASIQAGLLIIDGEGLYVRN